MTSERSLRDRLMKGAQAQVFGHVVKVIIQVGSVSILLSAWGLHEYGDWLLLAAIPTYLAFSDLGFLVAAQNDMIMSAENGDRDGALVVFQAVTRATTLGFAGLAVLLPVAATIVPISELLNLSVVDDSGARGTVIALGLNMLMTLYAAILFGGFACVGRYGEGGFAVAGLLLLEFAALSASALAGASTTGAAVSMLAARSVGTLAMYVWMRRYAPWLRLGRPPDSMAVLRRLFAPAMAAGAFPIAFALNLQGMLLMVGITLGSAAAATFSTLRTLSRVIIQLLSSIFGLVAPEVSKAFAAGDEQLLRTLHRRASQLAVWATAPTLALLAVLGPSIVTAWTSGEIEPERGLLYLFLAVVAIDSLWLTSIVVLVATNRHAKIAVIFLAASFAVLVVGYPLVQVWDLEGAALSLVLLELFMLFAALRQTLPAAYDSLGPWLSTVIRPPLFLIRFMRPNASLRDS